MAEVRSFSMKAIIFTAVITFLFSGIGTTYFQRWLQRPDIFATLSSIGFTGSNDLIEIPNNLQNSSRETNWINAYKKYHPFEDLSYDFRRISIILSDLHIAVQTTEEWINKNRSQFNNQENQLTIEQIVELPCCRIERIISTVLGMARRGELESTPIGSQDLDKFNKVTDFEKKGSAFILNLRDRNFKFPLPEDMTSGERDKIEVVFKSLSRGCGPNIVYYLDQFEYSANTELRRLTQLSNELVEVMTPNIRLAASISLYNSGKTPIILSPFCVLRIMNKNIEKNAFTLTTSGPLENEREMSIQKSGLKIVEATDTPAQPFLPNFFPTRYLFLPPEKEVQIQLESVEPLGSDGKRIKEAYDLNVLECQVLFKSKNDKVITTPVGIFGSGISQKERRQLIDYFMIDKL
jgi:hypothetical protein